MVVVASDNVSLLDRWAAALGGHGTLIRRVRQLDEAEGILSGRQPGVLLIDLALRDLNGAPGIAELNAFSPSTRIIAMGHQPSDDEGIAVLRAGARVIATSISTHACWPRRSRRCSWARCGSAGG